MKKAEIEGGATLWARQIIDSEIFINKPDKWFKIWFYLVNKVSHKDTKKYKRGETFLHYDWICDNTNATKDQVKKCIGWLKEGGMVSTRRSTRGVWLEITKYSYFQRLDNYYYNIKAPDEALEKHQRSTREAPRYYKNDKNDKNTIAETSSAEHFSFKDKLKEMKLNTKNPLIPIIAFYWEYKQLTPPKNEEQYQSKLTRELRGAKPLVDYPLERIKEVMKWLNSSEFLTEVWTIETIFKFIDRDLTKITDK